MRYLENFCQEYAELAKQYLRIDIPIGLISLLFLVLTLSAVTRATDNPQMLAAFNDDEPWQALSLEGMLEKPYGNPGNFLDPQSPAYGRIPPHWGYLRYPNIIYYGGSLPNIAFPFYAALRGLGLPAFPTSVILLRVLGALIAAMTLIVLYNFARRFGDRLAAIISVMYVASDLYFEHFSLYVHPDLLQVLVGLFALALAVRHSENGDLYSLAAVGFTCGLVQGTKIGGAWTVPMAFVALGFGMRAGGFTASAAVLLQRVLLLGGLAIAGWMVSTPYAFLDGYYFHRMSAVWKVQGFDASFNPFGQITMKKWLNDLIAYFGQFSFSLFIIAALRVVVSFFIRRGNLSFLLALILCVSQFLFYGLGQHWTQVYYFLLAFSLATVMIFDMIVTWSTRAVSFLSSLLLQSKKVAGVFKSITRTTLCTVFLLLLSTRVASFIQILVSVQLYRRDVVTFFAGWAKENIPQSAKILFNPYAFFDSNWFENVTLTWAIHWPIVIRYDPDYLVLSAGLPTNVLYKDLMVSQHRERDDPYPYSVRIYQDLFKLSSFGPSGVQGVDYVAKIEPQPLEDVAPGWQPPESPEWLRFAASQIWTTEEILLETGAMWESLRHPEDPPIGSVSGNGYRVFRINPPGTPNGRPVPLSSSMAKDRPPNLAFDRTLDYFQAADWDAKPFLGYDFGDQSATKVSNIRIQWVSGAFTPPSVAVEYSDDGATWVRSGEYRVNSYSDKDASFRTDSFPVAVDAPHRFWRVVATTLPRRALAIAELYLDAAGERPATAR